MKLTGRHFLKLYCSLRRGAEKCGGKHNGQRLRRIFRRALVPEQARLHVHILLIVGRARLGHEIEGRVGERPIQIPQHPFDVVMLVDDVRMQDVFIALEA